LHLPISEGKDILAKILENTPYTNVYDEAPKEEEDLAPKVEGTSIPETLQSTFQEPAIEPEPPTPNVPKEEEIQPLEFPFDIEDNLFSDFGNASNQPVQKKSTA